VHSCRRAQWAGTVGRIEDHALGGQTIDMRAFDVGIVIATQRERAELVGHDDEDVLHV
jgi:hypothetical protein